MNQEMKNYLLTACLQPCSMIKVAQFMNHYPTPLKSGYMVYIGHKIPILSRILAVFGSFWFTFWLKFRPVLVQFLVHLWFSLIAFTVQFWFSYGSEMRW